MIGRGHGVIDELSCICLEGLRRATEHLSQYSVCPGRDSNLALPITSLEHYRYTSLLGDTVESDR